MGSLKKSRFAVAVTAVFLFAALVFFIEHIHSVATNPADSGESALLFYMLALPWISLVPSSWTYWSGWYWLAYPVAWFCVVINALVIYLVVALAAAMVRRIAGKLGHRGCDR